MSYLPPQPHEEMIVRAGRGSTSCRRAGGSAWWDRIKVLLLLVGLLGFFVAAEIADNPILPISEAINETLRSKVWLLGLIGLELLRQIHYLISEHSAGYHQFWTKRVFGGWNRYVDAVQPVEPLPIRARGEVDRRHRRRRDHPRPHLRHVAGARLLRRAEQGDRGRAASSRRSHLPVFWIGFQFVLMFYFMTRGGVETFFPDDITHALLRRLGSGPGEAQGSREPALPRQPRGHRAEGWIRPRAGSCCGDHRARGRRSWPRPWPVRRACRSSTWTRRCSASASGRSR